jgi:DNA polymerase-1
MNGWAIPWEDWRGLAMEALREYDGTQIYHNIAFEMKWLHEHAPGGYRIPRDRSVDTMIAAHISNPLGAGGLKPLAAKYVDSKAANSQAALDDAMAENKWTWATVPISFRPYWMYGALDTVLTAHLWDKYRHEVGSGAPYQQVFDLEMAVRFIVTRMEERGARVDVEYARRKYQALHDEADEVERWARAAFGIKVSSNDQLGAKIIEMGGQLLDRTATGKPKVDKYTLQVLMDPENGESQELRLLAEQALRARKARKFASTYFKNFVEKNYGGVVHSEIRTLGARTGRMSISNPPLQQLPKGNALVRNAFVASEGNVLVTADYDQIEARVFAEMAEDAGLIEAFRVADATGGDFFVELGKQIYAAPDFQKSDKRRGLIKNVTYGKMYGAGVAKMAESAGVPVGRMEVVAESMDRQFPGMAEFMRQIESDGVKRQRREGQGYVVTPLGRRLPADDNRLYALTNYMIQSSAADVLKKALVRLDAAGYDEYMILPVHDEILVDIPAEYAEQAERDMPLLMQETDHAIPLSASSDGSMARWGDKYA